MLNINSVNLITNNIKQLPKKISFRGSGNDVFVKSTPDKTMPNKTENEFINWANSTNFLELPLKEILDDSNKIGSGFSHTTYNINGNDDYILRTANNCKYSMEDLNSSSKTIIDTKDNLDINIGQKIAEIKLDTKNASTPIEVLKKQTGTPIGVLPYSAISNEDSGELNPNELPYEDISRKQQYLKSIHNISELPVESYEKFILDLQEAAKSGYSLDHLNSNNLLYDEEKQSINLIDMNKRSKDADMGDALYALTNIYYFPTFIYENDSKQEVNQAFTETIAIFDKFTQAMKNLGVKFKPQEKSDYETHELMKSLPASFFFQTNDLQEKYNKLNEMGLI